MIIDELFKIKSEKIEEHKKRFSEIDENKFILEMFRKKYDETYNINYNGLKSKNKKPNHFIF